MPYLDFLNNPPLDPEKGGGLANPYTGGGGTGTPGGGYGGGGGASLPGGSFVNRRNAVGMSDILANRRKMLMGLPGANPAGASLATPETGPGTQQAGSGSPLGNNSLFGNPIFQNIVNRLGGAQGGSRTDQWGRSQAYNPNDPYAPYTNDPRGDINGLINRLLGQGGMAGAFDPNGGGSYMDALQQKLGVDAANRQSQAGIAARYFAGEDPAAAGYASLASTINGQSQDAQAMNDARLQQMQLVQSWLRSILGGAPDYAQQLAVAKASQPQQQGGGLGGVLGSIGGGAIGALFRPRGD